MSTRTPMSKVSKPPSGSNPFDSDSESELDLRPARASSAPAVNNEGFRRDDGKARSAFSYMGSSADKNRYKNDFRQAGGLESQSVQELEAYAVYKAEETTEKLNGCMKIAEEMREDASRTLVKLHQQGEQINRAHETTANIDYDLSRGEKLLGSLGGLFSKTWRPKRNHQLKGPLPRDDYLARSGSHLEQRQRLGLSNPTTTQAKFRQPPSEPTTALEKVQIEKVKQDDTLSDLSNLLGELKEMAVDMGSEIGRQNTALGRLDSDVDEVNFRVKGANQRARRLLGR